jgi:uncharacterized membrane protein
VNGYPNLVGIEDAVNNGTTLPMGTFVDPGGTLYTPSGYVYAPDLPVGSEVIAINNLGQIVGSYPDLDAADNGIIHGFVYTPGKNPSVVTLDYPQSTTCTFPTSINDAGWVVGTFMDMTSSNGFQYCPSQYDPQRCFLWKPPYTSNPPQPFDDFGSSGNCAPFNGIGSGPFVNGLGQYTGTSTVGQLLDPSLGAGSIFFDDVEAGVPGPGDDAYTAVWETSTTSSWAAGINNNG